MTTVHDTPIETPCIGVCRLDASFDLCVGCGRSGDEIGGWLTFDASRRRDVLALLPARLAALASRGNFS